MVAARRGVSMKSVIVAALEYELDGKAKGTEGNAIRFPLVHSKEPATYDLRPEEISRILVREETVAYEAADRR